MNISDAEVAKEYPRDKTWKKRLGFDTTVNAADFSYGFTSTYKIPGVNVFAATDMKMYSRRGYSVSAFNRNDLIWNASLSKSFFKGKLTARLEAFDLLHRLTN